ncbi:hypothetical protein BBBOND_0312450 [Babesia bigemina]|uniref:Uncharacterized protein n=1 Tax=Babesia bigemina TaxID=5866 RepID=A0A061DBM6_BABBI|nr:hypothetical protein BBBOND_0312450 [Babesia bigemina]CDR97342.1 hypothetical protein BBBOND_0312450 [Babesia bigemina]|eukprot:XP_012769528.1 hypothetical protein BBBOND_0312450 [Babesia bigemina]
MHSCEDIGIALDGDCLVAGGAPVGDCQCWRVRLRGLGGEDGGEVGRFAQLQTSAEDRSTNPSNTSSSPAPYIIVPVALVIVVICVMIYFRIRPFHRSNDCVDDKSHEQ